MRFVFPFNPLIKVSRHRPLPAAVDRARGAALPVADPVRSRRPAADLRRHRAARVRRRAGLALRPVQDDRLDDRHLVDQGRHDRRGDLPRGRATSPSTRRRRSSPACSRDDWDVYVHYFEFTDRVQHVMWRFFDPQHPLYTAGRARQLRRLDPQGLPADGPHRRRGDGRSGRHAGRTTLFVVSDHGFASWRRTMNYNTWLATEGYLVLKGAERPTAPTSRTSSTRASSSQRRLVEDPRLRHGPRQHLHQPEGPRGAGHRRAGRRVRGADRRDPRQAAAVRRPRDRRASGGLRLHPRRGLRHLRPGADPGPLPVQQRRLPRRLAGLPRHRRQVDRRAQPRRLERRPLLGLSAAGRRHPVREPRRSTGAEARTWPTSCRRCSTCSACRRRSSSTAGV